MGLLMSDIFLPVARILGLVTITSDTGTGTVDVRGSGACNLEVIVTVVCVVAVGALFEGIIPSESSLVRHCCVVRIWLSKDVLHVLRVLARLESEPGRLGRLEGVGPKA